MAFEVGAVVAHVKADISDFQDGMKKTKGELDEVGGKAGSLGTFLKVGLVAGATAAAAGIVMLGKSALEAAGDFEQTKISFEVMLGSAEKATKLLKELQEFAKATPFNLVELQEATKRLLAYGVEGDKMIETLRMLGDITAGVGKEKLPQLILAFGQVKAQTKLTGMELRQFSEAGVPLLQALTDQANKAGGAWVTVGGAAKKSKVDVGEMNDKLAIANQRLKEATESGKAKESTMMSLRNTVQNYTQKIGEAAPATEGTRKVWVKTKVTVEDMIQKVSDGEIKFADVQKALAGMTAEGGKFNDLMEKQAGTLQGSISNMQDSWQQLMVLLGTHFIPIATQVVQTLTSFLTPIMEVLNGSKSLGEAFNLTGEQSKMLKMVLDEFKSFLFDTLMPAVQTVVTYLISFWNQHKVEFIAIWTIIWGVIQVLWALIYGLIKVGLELLAGDWKGAWDAIKQATSTAWEGIKNIIIGAFQFIWKWGEQVYDALTSPFRRAWEDIKNLVKGIKDALDFTKRHSPSVVDIVERGVGLVNKALAGIDVGITPVNPSISGGFAPAMSGGGISANHINIDMSGAVISDAAGAMRIGEIMGDEIIRKLQTNVRF